MVVVVLMWWSGYDVCGFGSGGSSGSGGGGISRIVVFKVSYAVVLVIIMKRCESGIDIIVVLS